MGLATAAHVSEAEVTAAASTLARDANGARYTEALVAEAKSKLTEIRVLNPAVENATLKRVRGYKHHLAWDEGKAMFAGKTTQYVEFTSEPDTLLKLGYVAKNEWGGQEGTIQYFFEKSTKINFGKIKVLGEVFK